MEDATARAVRGVEEKTAMTTTEVRFFGPYICGEHFCDSCGDCMACYSDDSCIDGGYHICFVEVDEDAANNS